MKAGDIVIDTRTGDRVLILRIMFGDNAECRFVPGNNRPYGAPFWTTTDNLQA